jgi:hypothetical protein
MAAVLTADREPQRAELRRRFGRILDRCQTYLVASRLGAADQPRGHPLILPSAPTIRVDPFSTRSEFFLTLLQRLNAVTYGPAGRPTPRWVFYDCAEMPGGIFGFAMAAERLPGWGREMLEIPEGYAGPVPVSMLVTIPMLEPGAWHTYGLCSLNEAAAGAAPSGLRLLTLVEALALLGVQTVVGSMRWRSARLPVHVSLGSLELVTAWTPAHSEPRTLTYRLDITAEGLLDGLGASAPLGVEKGETRWIDVDDDLELQALQTAIEEGHRFVIVGPPRIDGSMVRVPVRAVQR